MFKRIYLKIILCNLFCIGILFSQVPENWNYSQSDYEYYMTLTAEISVNGNVVSDPYFMGVFSGNDCRGYAEAIEVNDDQYVYFVIIYGNIVDMGSFMNIKLFDDENDVEYPAFEQLMFISSVSNGDPDNLFQVSFNCDDMDNDGICDVSDDCFGVYDECGICNGGGISEGHCDCDGNVLDECGVCSGDNSDMDCAGVCNGNAILDDCDVCNGNNSDMDCAGVCNGDAVVDFCGICDGNNADIDCSGQCFGDAVIDECGICGGDGIPDDACDCDGNELDCNGVCGGEDVIDCNDVCGGGAEIDECGVCGGYGIPDGTCDCNGNTEGCSMELTLLDGANLISFYIIPDDNSVSNVLSVFGENAFNLIGEGIASSQVQPGIWAGSLTTIDPTDGYWIQLIEPQTVEMFGNTTDLNIEYNLLDGANLISWPRSLEMDITLAIPDNVEGNFLSIIGEGIAATQVSPHNWQGSLNTFQPGKGYWIILTDATNFSFTPY